MDSSMVLGVAAVIGAVVVLVLLIAAVAMLAFFVRRKGADAGAGRSEALAGVGYDARGDGTFARPLQGSQLVYRDTSAGARWELRLPRYNTMTLELVEASSGEGVSGGFESGIAKLDERFKLGSPQAARVVALLGQDKLQKALLRVPNIALRLSADELVIEDPGNAGRAQLQAGTAVDNEVAMNRLVENVVNALFGSLYTEDGTVFDQYR